MLYLNAGEWWTANIFFGIAFVITAIGIVGIAWYVLRGDKLNRAAMPEPHDEFLEKVTGVEDQAEELKAGARATVTEVR